MNQQHPLPIHPYPTHEPLLPPAGDPQVMRRLMELLTAPLADWQALSYGQYAEWVAVRFRVNLLQAHAQVSA